MKKIFLILFLLIPAAAISQSNDELAPVTTTQVAPGVFRLFVNERVATALFVGADGVMLIDAAYEQTAPQLKAAIEALTNEPIQYLVNTHHHGDHVGGNVELGSNVTIIAHQFVKDYVSTEHRAGERVIPAMEKQGWPGITFSDEMNLDFNGQTLQMIHLPKGHTAGDIIIYFPASKVLVAGDLLFADNFPYVDVSSGGDPMGYLKNQQYILENFPADLTVIGGHGPIYNMERLSEYHAELQKTVEVVRQAKQQGMTAEQMKANRILKDWEAWGKFFITEDRWIDTLFPVL
ncbi:MAG: MBL fold metallo-hydrolase [Bacteroides sp.]|nr:MBL fold metallo-hydrolase [Bacteroides sp.]